MLRCDNLGFSYDNETWILRDVCLYAGAGEIVTVMGRSGCGKTTLLNILNGILQATMGSCYHKGHSPVTIFQDKRLIPWQTIAENVCFGAKVMGLSLSHGQVDQALLNVGLSPRIKDGYPKVLSGGMAQRVAIARAFACCPDLIFMDEPFSALDTATRQELMYRVADYIESQQATGILVTHDKQEAASLSHRIYELRGYPASLKKVLLINDSPKRRSDKRIMKIMEEITQTKESESHFPRHGLIHAEDCVDNFIADMNSLGWRFSRVRGGDTPDFTQPPDCIILSGDHPQADALIESFSESLTRFLWLRTIPKAVSAQTIGNDQNALIDWWGWEKIYDDLAMDAPTAVVEDVLIGHNWSFVRTAKGAGLARTPCRGTEGPRAIPEAGALIGKTVADLAQGLTSRDDLQRSLAIAALSSVYNYRFDGRVGEENWGFRLFRESGGEKACVGAFPPASTILPDIKIIEREPQQGHYTVEEGDSILRSSQCVVITAQTLMNGSLPRLLFLAQKAAVMLLGPTLILSPVWKKYGVRYACGVRVTDAKAMHRFIAQAGTMLLQDHMAEKVTLEF